MNTWKKVILQKTNAVTVFRSGHQALAEIEGLRGIAVRGMILNYLIFFVVTLALNVLFYYQVLSPFINWLFGGGDGFWAVVRSVVLWGIQLTVAAVFALIALRISFELLSLWHQSLVLRIIKHFRQIEEQDFSFKVWLANIKNILKETLKSCLFPIILLFFGLIPVIGPLIVFALASYLLGRESTVVYLDSLTDPEEAAELRRSWLWLPVIIGWLPTMLAFIPFVGWFFLPLMQTYEVIGFAYLVEKSRNS